MEDGAIGGVADPAARSLPVLLRLAPWLAASGLFALMAALYAFGLRAPYYAIVRGFGIDVWPWPFLDTDTVLSAVRCVQKGVDVYAANPCDVLERVYDYSPLWLVLARVPGLGEWLTAIGLAVDLAFLAALLLLPVARDGRGAALIVLAVISSAPIYAVERGNNDLVIFVLATIAATLVTRSRHLRLLAYGAALLAGLLKYYPMPLLVLATRERPGRFFAIAAAAVLVVGLFLAVSGHELIRALQLIPVGPYLSEMFGSTTLTGGLSQLYGWPEGARRMLHGVMVVTAFAVAILLGRRPSRQRELDRLTERERAFLFVGAVLIPSYFFTAQNIGYRAVHLLLVVPPLIALWRSSGGRALGWSLAAAIGLLWSEEIRMLAFRLTAGRDPVIANGMQLGVWLFRETAWWWLVTILLSFVVALVLRSEMGGVATGFADRLLRTPRAGAPLPRPERVRS